MDSANQDKSILPTEASAQAADNSLLDLNLSRSPEGRAIHHQKAYETLQEILRARKALYGEPEQSPETAPRE